MSFYLKKSLGNKHQSQVSHGIFSVLFEYLTKEVKIIRDDDLKWEIFSFPSQQANLINAVNLFIENKHK